MHVPRILSLVAITSLSLWVEPGCRHPPEATAAVEAEKEEEKGGEGRLDRIELTDEALDSLDLQYAVAEVRELAPSVALTAEIVTAPDRRAEVGSRVAGRVTRVYVNVGDRVRRGDPLVALESPEAGRAQADLLSAGARVEVARRAFARKRALLEEKIASQREVDEAEAEVRTSNADLAAARALLSSFGLGSSGAGSDSGRVVLASPIDGTVIGRTVHVGRYAQASDTLVEVADLDEVWLLADVFEQDLRLLAPGLPVEVQARAWPDQVFRGRLDHVGDVLDEHSRTVKVRVVLPNPDRRLKPGMFATARVRGVNASGSRKMLVVPWAAIQVVDDHPAVFAKAGDDSFEVRKVHTGDRAGDDVEVLNGLATGETVVTEGSFLLKGELLKSTLGEEE
jgi:cobalt-zinc-cadmium efflux system membrane fusion protein